MCVSKFGLMMLLTSRGGASGGVPELYKKAKAAAALAASAHPSASATSSPLHPTFLSARPLEDSEASREPGSHPQGGAETSGRQPVNDMFR